MNSEKSREQTTLERRQLIVESAEICFARKGFHQTSMRDLANQAGVSLGNLYNHFKNKSELILEIARLESIELEEFRAELAKISDPLLALEQFVFHYAHYCAEPRNALLAAEILTEAMRNPDIKSGFEENRQQLLQTLISIIGAIDAAQGRGNKNSPGDRAGFVLDLTEGYAMRLALNGHKLGKKELSILNTGVHQLVGIGGN